MKKLTAILLAAALAMVMCVSAFAEGNPCAAGHTPVENVLDEEPNHGMVLLEGIQCAVCREVLTFDLDAKFAELADQAEQNEYGFWDVYVDVEDWGLRLDYHYYEDKTPMVLNVNIAGENYEPTLKQFYAEDESGRLVAASGGENGNAEYVYNNGVLEYYTTPTMQSDGQLRWDYYKPDGTPIDGPELDGSYNPIPENGITETKWDDEGLLISAKMMWDGKESNLYAIDPVGPELSFEVDEIIGYAQNDLYPISFGTRHASAEDMVVTVLMVNVKTMDEFRREGTIGEVITFPALTEGSYMTLVSADGCKNVVLSTIYNVKNDAPNAAAPYLVGVTRDDVVFEDIGTTTVVDESGKPMTGVPMMLTLLDANGEPAHPSMRCTADENGLLSLDMTQAYADRVFGQPYYPLTFVLAPNWTVSYEFVQQ